MKRFYCTVCKKVKRVRRLPRLIENSDSTVAVERIGECNSHANPYPRRVMREYRIVSSDTNTLQTVGSRVNRKARGK